MRVYTVCIQFRNPTKYGNNENKQDIAYIENEPVQRPEVEESIRQKWVKVELNKPSFRSDPNVKIQVELCML